MMTRPVGLSRDLPAGRVMRAEADGADLAIWRSAAGALSVWGNRCPHRGMRLSHGFVRDGGLTCLYHGWRFGPEGRCRYIPAHPDLDPPATITAEVYSGAEAHGVIWAAAEGEATPPALSPGFSPLRSFAVHASEGAVLEAAGGPSPVISGHAAALLTNPISAARTQICVLLSEAATTPDRKAASRWCEALRRALEEGAAS